MFQYKKITMNYLKIGSIIALNIMTIASFAQQAKRDSIIPDQTIIIHKVYKPEISKQAKPEIVPSLPVIDTARPTFNYEVPQQTLSYTYHSVPIRPLALGKQAERKMFQNYLKLGFGNLSSIYGDAGIGGLTGENYTSAFHISHLSQGNKGTPKKTNQTTFDASAQYFAKNHIYHMGLDFFRKGYNYYGYDQNIYQFPNKLLKQHFTGGQLSFGLENTGNDLKIKYAPQITIGLMGDHYKAVENQLDFSLPASYLFQEDYLFSLALEGSVVTYKPPTLMGTSNNISSNNYLKIKPAADFNLSNLNIHAGLYPTIGKENRFYLLPDFQLSYAVWENQHKVLAGWKSNLVQNTFKQLTDYNPFMYSRYSIAQSKTDHVFVGFESTFGKHMTIAASGTWKQWKNRATFINAYDLSTDGKTFRTIYNPRLNSYGIDASFQYQLAEVFGVQVALNWDRFYHSDLEKMWQEPQLKLKSKIQSQPVKNLTLNATVDYWDKMYARNNQQKVEKIPAFLDLGFQAEYEIIPRFSIFLQLNNILNDKYQRWYQYDNCGMNVLGGARLKF